MMKQLIWSVLCISLFLTACNSDKTADETTTENTTNAANTDPAPADDAYASYRESPKNIKPGDWSGTSAKMAEKLEARGEKASDGPYREYCINMYEYVVSINASEDANEKQGLAQLMVEELVKYQEAAGVTDAISACAISCNNAYDECLQKVQSGEAKFKDNGQCTKMLGMCVFRCDEIVRDVQQ